MAPSAERGKGVRTKTPYFAQSLESKRLADGQGPAQRAPGGALQIADVIVETHEAYGHRGSTKSTPTEHARSKVISTMRSLPSHVG